MSSSRPEEGASAPAGRSPLPEPAGSVRVVLVSGPDEAFLLDLGRVLVSERLAACVNVLPSVSSVYRWAGVVEEADEALALVKTTSDRLEALTAQVRRLHPYDEPEVIALPVVGGSPSYLTWVIDGLGG